MFEESEKGIEMLDKEFPKILTCVHWSIQYMPNVAAEKECWM